MELTYNTIHSVVAFLQLLLLPGHVLQPILISAKRGSYYECLPTGTY